MTALAENQYRSILERSPPPFGQWRCIRTQTFARALARTGFDFNEFKIEHLASEQLQKELDDSIIRDKAPKIDGIQDSPLYTKLPPEIRLLIFSYLVTCEESIHLHPVKGNLKLGFRLSRCGDALLNMETGNCNCERGFSFRVQNNNPPPYVDTELLLVSRTVRREALDLLFTTNNFTFTSLRDLNGFAETFTHTVSKLQHIQILERAQDGCHSIFHNQGIAQTREKLGHLKSLKLHLYLDHFSTFETPYPDGFLTPFLPLYFSGPITTPSGPTDQPTPIPPTSVIITARTTRLWSEPNTLAATADYVADKLRQVFASKWRTAEEVPMAPKPPRRVLESERAPQVKKGLLCLGD